MGRVSPSLLKSIMLNELKHLELHDGEQRTQLTLASITSRTQLARLAGKAETYSGKEGDQPIRTWLQMMQQWLIAGGCSERDHVTVAALYLRGRAAQHWTAVRPAIAASGEHISWDTFCKYMILAFGAYDPQTIACR